MKKQPQPRMSLSPTAAVLLVAAFMLAACSGSNAPVSEPPQAENPAVENNTANDTNPDDAPDEAETDEVESGESPEEPADEQDSASPVSFSEDVFPILQSRCLTCHGGDRIEAELVMFSYDDLLAGSENGAVIVPGDVENSLLAQLIIEQEMPKRGPKLTPTQTQTILDWIAQGAQNN